MKVDEILAVGLSHRPPVLRVLEFRERHRRVGWPEKLEDLVPPTPAARALKRRRSPG